MKHGQELFSCQVKMGSVYWYNWEETWLFLEHFKPQKRSSRRVCLMVVQRFPSTPFHCQARDLQVICRSWKALFVLQLPKIREFKLLAKKVVEKHWILGSVYVFSATFLRRHWKSDKIKQLWATSYHFSPYFYTLAGVIMEPWMNPT